MDDIAIGRKEIMKALHVSTWQTVKRWRVVHSLPIHNMPNGRPMLFLKEFKLWAHKYSELKKSKQP